MEWRYFLFVLKYANTVRVRIAAVVTVAGVFTSPSSIRFKTRYELHFLNFVLFLLRRSFDQSHRVPSIRLRESNFSHSI